MSVKYSLRPRVIDCARLMATQAIMNVKPGEPRELYRFAVKVRQARDGDFVFNDLTMRVEALGVPLASEVELAAALETVWPQAAAEFGPGGKA